MSNKYLEKIAGFNGQSLGHLEGKARLLSDAIDNHRHSFGSSFGGHTLKRKLNMVLSNGKATIGSEKKIDKARDRLDRVNAEIYDRHRAANPLSQLLYLLGKK